MSDIREKIFYRVSEKQIIELRDAALEAGKSECVGVDTEKHYAAVEREAKAFHACREKRIR